MSVKTDIQLIANDVYDIKNQIVDKSESAPNTVQVAIGIIATRIVVKNLQRKSIIIRNVGSSDIYIGSLSVTVNSGLLLRLDDVLILDKTKGEIYAISDSIAGIVVYLEE